MTLPVVDLTDPDAMIGALAASHAHLDRLSVTAPETPTLLPGWPVAQVLSHLGSGAQIGSALLGRALDGASAVLDRTEMSGIWDRWNALPPDEQAAQRRTWDARHLALLEGLTSEQRRTLRVPYFVGPLRVAEYAGYRLSEHAVHTWDVEVALDPDARIDPDALAVLWARLDLIVGRFHDAEVRARLAPVSITLRPTDGAGPSTLEIRPDSVALVPGAHGVTEARGPLDALVRLAYGRLDPDRRPDDRLTGPGAAELAALFPGY